jgi:hypothetical protein
MEGIQQVIRKHKRLERRGWFMDKNDFTWKIKFCPMVKDVAKWK